MSRDDVSSLGATWTGVPQFRDASCHADGKGQSLQITGIATLDVDTVPSPNDIEKGHKSPKKPSTSSSSNGCLPVCNKRIPGFLRVTIVAAMLVFLASITLLTILLLQISKGGKGQSSSLNSGSIQGIDLGSYRRATPALAPTTEKHISTPEPALSPDVGKHSSAPPMSPTPPTLPQTSLPECEDQPGTFRINELQLTCSMMHSSAIFQGLYCIEGFEAYNRCPKTCNNCPAAAPANKYKLRTTSAPP